MDLTRVRVIECPDAVGGEPGEDPHLRFRELDRVLYEEPSEIFVGTGSGTTYPIDSFGGECFDEDSRVRDAWMAIFQMLYDVLLR